MAYINREQTVNCRNRGSVRVPGGKEGVAFRRFPVEVANSPKGKYCRADAPDLQCHSHIEEKGSCPSKSVESHIHNLGFLKGVLFR